jgi:hypothetical protein
MVVAIMIMMFVVTAIPVVTAVFAADVMAVNPPLSQERAMAGDPNHFVVTLPVTGAMAVVGSVADVDFKSIRPHGCRENDTRGEERDEKEFCLNHTSDSCVIGKRPAFFLEGEETKRTPNAEWRVEKDVRRP